MDTGLTDSWTALDGTSDGWREGWFEEDRWMIGSPRLTLNRLNGNEGGREGRLTDGQMDASSRMKDRLIHIIRDSLTWTDHRRKTRTDPHRHQTLTTGRRETEQETLQQEGGDSPRLSKNSADGPSLSELRPRHQRIQTQTPQGPLLRFIPSLVWGRVCEERALKGPLNKCYNGSPPRFRVCLLFIVQLRINL